MLINLNFYKIFVNFILALLNNINGRKERKRTTSKKDEIPDVGGGSKSGSASRCISPDIKEVSWFILKILLFLNKSFIIR